jgi:hypothetical protein
VLQALRRQKIPSLSPRRRTLGPAESNIKDELFGHIPKEDPAYLRTIAFIKRNEGCLPASEKRMVAVLCDLATCPNPVACEYLGARVRPSPAASAIREAEVKRGKNGTAGAEAILLTMRFVSVKTMEQQSIMMLHRVR